jgi:hypothetical protein
MVKEFMLVSCLAYSSALMMESTRSSKMTGDFQHITQHYIPGDKLFNIVTHHKQQKVHENNLTET